jgi:hypothetical protein
MTKIGRNASLILFFLLVVVGTSATDEEHGQNGILKTRLKGFQEVPAVSSNRSGEFKARISEDDTKIDFTLKWSNLEGTTVNQAHIHFGQFHVNGGIMTFLCSSDFQPPPNPPNPSPSSPTYPGPSSGTVEGSITASNIIGPAGQGIAEMEFAEVLRAIRSGNSYVNVHTDKFPGGEIRGQLGAPRHDDDGNENNKHRH